MPTPSTESSAWTESFVGDHKATLDLYRALVTPRLIEEKMLHLIRQNRLAKWFSGYGQEAIAVGCTWALEEEDWILPMHRNLGVWTTRGVPLDSLFCQLMGKAGGYTKGRDRTFHFGLPSHHLVGMISHLGAMLPVADGLALAGKLKGESRVSCAFVGEGATREGDFHEALTLASSWKLPVIFVVENNGYGLSTPASEVIPIENIAEAATGYGMPGEVVDGNDILAVIDAVSRAAARGRSAEGPTLLEMKTFRMRGHEEASGTKYVPEELFERWRMKDPVQRFRTTLLEEGVADEYDLAQIEKEIRTEVEKTAEWAITQPEQLSTVTEEVADVFAPAVSVRQRADDAVGSRKEQRFIDALSDGLFDTMKED
ncbi:MAG: thiamine pyrophosphate-dependent dehydrogenase E1 component subunit alpha, partial [Rubricoccaceae bacterium]|nr:thiamine pyrophosphate-dependent dehydrogenase E1 component subunit alpha [Rubricoccaceae bacterium]